MATESITGTISKVFKAGAKWSAGRIETTEGSVPFAGKLFAQPLMQVTLHGTWVDDEKWGRQFSVAYAQSPSGAQGAGGRGGAGGGDEASVEVNEVALAAYLEGLRIAGLGPATARRIAEACQTRETFAHTITEQPEWFVENLNVKQGIITALRESWLAGQATNDARLRLTMLGLSGWQIDKLIDRYHADVIRVITTRPFAVDISGFGFQTLDAIAGKVGIAKDDPERICAGIRFALEGLIRKTGSTLIPRADLIRDAVKLLGLPRATIDQAAVPPVIETLDGDQVTTLDMLTNEDAIRDGIFFRQGEPNPCRLHEPVQGTLNESQFAALKMAHCESVMILCGAGGSGKAQPLDAKVLTPTGWRLMGDLKVGDEVIGANGFPCRVTGVFPRGEREVFKVTMTDGSSTECCDEHLWNTRSQDDRDHNRPGKVKPLHEIRNTLKTRSGKHRNHWIPIVEPVEFVTQEEPPLDPYLMGLLLGDGHFTKHYVGFSKGDLDLIEIANECLPRGHALKKTVNRQYDYRVRGEFGINRTLMAIRDLGVDEKRSHEKFIPPCFLLASAEDRLALLQGLLDTDGSPSRNHTVEYSTTSRQLAEDVMFIIRSLGGTCSFAERQTYFTYKGERKPGRPSYRMFVCLPKGVPPFRGERKSAKYKPRAKYFPRRAIVSVEPIGKKPVQCIAVDAPDHLYVTDDFIVTHNTHTMNEIVAMYENSHKNVVLLAPTGKAARRMTEVSNHEAFTIHKFLKLGSRPKTKFESKDSQPVDGRSTNDEIIWPDLIIVDESSMVDSELMSTLLKTVPADVNLIFIGDPNQLPPVGPGAPFRDMINAKVFPMVELTQVMRQSGALRTNAFAILEGSVSPSEYNGDQLAWWLMEDASLEDHVQTQRFIHDALDKYLPEMGYDIRTDVQFMTPQKTTELGTIEMNRWLQQYFQHKFYGVTLPDNFNDFLVHDRVIQRKNNYEKGVVNGDIGKVVHVDKDKSVIVEFDSERQVTYTRGELGEIMLAYAITIHRMQGSQCPVAMFVIHRKHSYMHDRNLLYTAATRATKLAVIIGDPVSIRACAARKRLSERRTILAKRLSSVT